MQSDCNQTLAYLNDSKLFLPLQSAYRPRHSTETALLKIVNAARSRPTHGLIVVMLDYSAAFDTLDTALLSTYFRTNLASRHHLYNDLSSRIIFSLIQLSDLAKHRH